MCFFALRSYFKIMNLNNYLSLIAIIFVFGLVTACSDQEPDRTASESPSVIESEPVDEEFTKRLQANLDEQLIELTQQQTDDAEQEQNEALEELSEQDRETLIDETAEQGSKQVKEDADKLIDILEDIAAQNE